MTSRAVQDRQEFKASALSQRVRVALGRAPADLLLADCRIVNVFSEEIHEADIAVTGGRIVGVRRGIPARGDNVVDCRGQLALPGLIHPFLPVSGGQGSSGLSGGAGSSAERHLPSWRPAPRMGRREMPWSWFRSSRQ